MNCLRGLTRWTATATAVVVLLLPAPSFAHGTLSDPPSRVYVCRWENPENPRSSACKAAISASGTQAFYDWNEVSLLDVGGQHQARIPDGHLCSAGRDKYRGLDLARVDWPATRVTPGPRTVTYHATAPHANGDFSYYITRSGWDPTRPLGWSDLVHLVTIPNQNPTTFTTWTIQLPQRTGRHILYSIWQRTVGSAEAFYACADIEFAGANAPAPRASSPPPPTTSTPPAPQPRATPPTPDRPVPSRPGSTWAPGIVYVRGDSISYEGEMFQCRQTHAALPGWEPPFVPSLWQGPNR